MDHAIDLTVEGPEVDMTSGDGMAGDMIAAAVVAMAEATAVAEPDLIPAPLLPPAPHAQPLSATQQPPKSQQDLRYSQREKRPARQKVVMDEYAEQPQHLSNPRYNRFSLEAMQQHLDKISIGLRPGDPTFTFDDLPDELPPPLHAPTSTTQVIDLKDLNQQQLNAMAAESQQGDPWAVLLEDPPGAPKDRLGKFTGQDRAANGTERHKKPPKRSSGPARTLIPHAGHAGGGRGAPLTLNLLAPGQEEAFIAYLDAHISAGKDVSWESLGRPSAPQLSGVAVQVLPLWEAVQSMGGYELATAHKKWNAIGRLVIGVDKNTSIKGYKFKELYAKHLLAYELVLKVGMTAAAAVAAATRTWNVKTPDSAAGEDEDV